MFFLRAVVLIVADALSTVTDKLCCLCANSQSQESRTGDGMYPTRHPLLRKWLCLSWRPLPSTQFATRKAGIKTSTRKARIATKLIAGVADGINDSRKYGVQTEVARPTKQFGQLATLAVRPPTGAVKLSARTTAQVRKPDGVSSSKLSAKQ